MPRLAHVFALERGLSPQPSPATGLNHDDDFEDDTSDEDWQECAESESEADTVSVISRAPRHAIATGSNVPVVALPTDHTMDDEYGSDDGHGLDSDDELIVQEGMHLHPLPTYPYHADADLPAHEYQDWSEIVRLMARIFARDPAQHGLRILLFKQLGRETASRLGWNFDSTEIPMSEDESLPPDWLDSLGHLFEHGVPRAEPTQGPATQDLEWRRYHTHDMPLSAAFTAEVLQTRQRVFSRFCTLFEQSTGKRIEKKDHIIRYFFQMLDSRGVEHLQTIVKHATPEHLNIYVAVANLHEAAKQQTIPILQELLNSSAGLLNCVKFVEHEQVRYFYKVLYAYQLCECRITLYRLLQIDKDEAACRALGISMSALTDRVIRRAIFDFITKSADIQTKNEIAAFQRFYYAASCAYISIGVLGWTAAFMLSSCVWNIAERMGLPQWHSIVNIFKLVLQHNVAPDCPPQEQYNALDLLQGPGEFLALYMFGRVKMDTRPNLAKLDSIDQIVERFDHAGIQMNPDSGPPVQLEALYILSPGIDSKDMSEQGWSDSEGPVWSEGDQSSDSDTLFVSA